MRVAFAVGWAMTGSVAIGGALALVKPQAPSPRPHRPNRSVRYCSLRQST
jgi:hypothetical protein